MKENVREKLTKEWRYQMKTKEEILRIVEEEDVVFVRLQFTDVFGNLKNVAIPSSRLNRALDNKFIVDVSSMFDAHQGGEEEMYLYPDLDTFVILPWRPQQGKVARMLCDVYDLSGKLCTMSPRTILKNVLDSAQEEGYTFYVDPECEFFLFHTDADGKPTTLTHENAGYMSVGPFDLGENARREMVMSLEQMGFEIEASHHENAPAQHEIDFREAEAGQIADSIITLRTAVRSVAKRFGLYATFMPKPKKDVDGSGMHMNFSAYKDDRNIFNYLDNDNNLRDEARWFIGGILKHSAEMCVFTNPTINSYKRLTRGFEAPIDIVWSKVNKNPAVKIWNRPFEDNKMEVRFPDSSANPYLVIALCVAAGMDGIKNKIEPGEPVGTVYDIDAVEQLPPALFEAVRVAKKSEFIKSVLGEDFLNFYISSKRKECDEYMKQVSDWEINKYLSKL